MQPIFSSAVKLLLLLLVTSTHVAQLDAKRAAAWKLIQPATVILKDGARVAGRAALIDSRGYFIAHRTSVPKAVLDGVDSEGRTYKLTRAATDEPSGLVLLIATGWSKTGVAPFELPTEPPEPGTGMLGVIGGGPIATELVSTDRFGVLAPSSRLVQLTEVQFESPSQLVGGALLFTYDGKFLGALNATLEAHPETPAIASSLVPKARIQSSFGPSQLTVAYTIGIDGLRTVIDGFKTPTHEVWRPQFGIACRDAEGGGALVEAVTPGSPAEKAGIKIGDVIFQIDKTPVHFQVDFFKALLQENAGATVSVSFLRLGATLIVPVTLGKSKS